MYCFTVNSGEGSCCTTLLDSHENLDRYVSALAGRSQATIVAPTVFGAMHALETLSQARDCSQY